MAKKRKKKGGILAVYNNIPLELKVISISLILSIIGLFLLLSVLGVAGTAGEWTNAILHNGESAIFGSSIYLFILILFLTAFLLIFEIEFISLKRFILGSTLLFFSYTTFISSAEIFQHGIIGDFIEGYLTLFLGLFSSIVLISLILISLFILNVFSPVAIWNWVVRDNGDKDEEEEEYEEEEEEEEYEEEEYEEEE